MSKKPQATRLFFSSFLQRIHHGFLSQYRDLKLEHDMLDEKAHPIVGVYTLPVASADVGVIEVPENGLDTRQLSSKDVNLARFTIPIPGELFNLNTRESLENDADAHLNRAGEQILASIDDKESIYNDPSQLLYFMIVSYFDFKKYVFRYRFALPRIVVKNLRWVVREQKSLTKEDHTPLSVALQSWIKTVPASQRAFFIAIKSNSSWKISKIREFENVYLKAKPEHRFLGFFDPTRSETSISCLLRTFLYFTHKAWNLEDFQLICFRNWHEAPHLESKLLKLKQVTNKDMPSDITYDGWFRTYSPSDKNKYNDGPQEIDLNDELNDNHIAAQQVSLNLKLMKWRLAPSLNLDAISSSRCLLLGAGTLGCYISRQLLAWNVRKITFVDNGTIKFSNPVRQPLFNFEDCLPKPEKLDGKPNHTYKSLQAAEALKKIFPGVESEGHVLSIPMIGHSILPDADHTTRKEFGRLVKLFDEHDVIFLLTDNRESRWLPTLMGKTMNKKVITTALGFDSYTVMRHGLFCDDKFEGGEELSCYFCNDASNALRNTQKDITLDQQCTVTLPGVAPIASGHAVEIFSSMSQHSLGARVPSDKEGPLGKVRHHITATMRQFIHKNMSGSSSAICSACGRRVVEAFLGGYTESRADADKLPLYWSSNGKVDVDKSWKFVRHAVNNPNWLFEFSGQAGLMSGAGIDDADEDDVEWEE